MNQKDFKSMSVDELWLLHQEIRDVLAAKLIAERRALEDRLLQLKQGSVVGQNTPSVERRPYPTVLPKFRNPECPSETWAGRGKTPRWLMNKLQSGKQIDDFRIVENAA